MGPVKGRLQICGSSRLAAHPPLVHAIHQAGFAVEMVECLDQCFRCRSSCFALASGRLVFAAGPDDMWRKLGLPASPPLPGTPGKPRLRVAQRGCNCSYCRRSRT